MTGSRNETPVRPTATSTGEPSFDQRWAAWEAKGLAQDRATRRRMALLAPVIVIAAAIVYGLLGR